MFGRDPPDKPKMVSSAQTVNSLDKFKSITEEISQIIDSLKTK